MSEHDSNPTPDSRDLSLDDLEADESPEVRGGAAIESPIGSGPRKADVAEPGLTPGPNLGGAGTPKVPV